MLGPVGPRCSGLVKIGGLEWGEDNAKWACGLGAAQPAAAANEECVVYSIGSHGEWGFEHGAPRARAPRCAHAPSQGAGIRRREQGRGRIPLPTPRRRRQSPRLDPLPSVTVTRCSLSP